ncbi:MAG TPA: hypothetical protein VN612_06830 [Acidobacteriaceae bacterium]|nr:hypothetical protein [Acidobacteriaceae bacterium]
MIRDRIAGALRAVLPLLAFTALPLAAQSMDDLNIQLHGYATQGFLYTNHNSWNGTDSASGSAQWTEAVVNVSAQPESKLRIGVQARYFLLGDYGDSITLDWAQIDYRANEKFGVRAGKVKTPTGLWNETQDIDPAQMWALLPQSIYQIASRDSLLDHFGGVVYGAISLGERSKIEYRGFGGTRIISGSDSVFQPLRDAGMSVPNGIRGPVYGGALHWQTPLSGLMVGASEDVERPAGEILVGPMQGTISSGRVVSPDFFAKYERGRIMAAAEYDRTPVQSTIQLTGLPAIPDPTDYRAFYLMASYKVSSKLSAGAYYSSFINRRAAVSSSRFQKDWTVAGRYDFNSFLYAKAEQHFIDGTAVGFNASDNPDLQPATRMTILKLGVSF